MKSDPCGNVLLLAAKDIEFMRRLIANPGTALAEEGFILDDQQMSRMRPMIVEVQGLPERTARERIRAMAHAHRRIEEK